VSRIPCSLHARRIRLHTGWLTNPVTAAVSVAVFAREGLRVGATGVGFDAVEEGVANRDVAGEMVAEVTDLHGTT
jgi:hypothetical protein